MSVHTEFGNRGSQNVPLATRIFPETNPQDPSTLVNAELYNAAWSQIGIAEGRFGAYSALKEQARLVDTMIDIGRPEGAKLIIDYALDKIAGGDCDYRTYDGEPFSPSGDTIRHQAQFYAIFASKLHKAGFSNEARQTVELALETILLADSSDPMYKQAPEEVGLNQASQNYAHISANLEIAKTMSIIGRFEAAELILEDIAPHITYGTTYNVAKGEAAIRVGQGPNYTSFLDALAGITNEAKGQKQLGAYVSLRKIMQQIINGVCESTEITCYDYPDTVLPGFGLRSIFESTEQYGLTIDYQPILDRIIKETDEFDLTNWQVIANYVQVAHFFYQTGDKTQAVNTLGNAMGTIIDASGKKGELKPKDEYYLKAKVAAAYASMGELQTSQHINQKLPLLFQNAAHSAALKYLLGSGSKTALYEKAQQVQAYLEQMEPAIGKNLALNMLRQERDTVAYTKLCNTVFEAYAQLGKTGKARQWLKTYIKGNKGPEREWAIHDEDFERRAVALYQIGDMSSAFKALTYTAPFRAVGFLSRILKDVNGEDTPVPNKNRQAILGAITVQSMYRYEKLGWN